MVDVEKDWYSNLPTSFSGRYRSYDYYSKRLTKKQIDNEFKKIDIYSKFRQYKKPTNYSPIYVRKKRQCFEADIVKFTDRLMLEATKNVANLLTIIDCFTKKVWLFPLAKISGENMKRCFKTLFNDKRDIPQNLRTDSGGEFVNRHVKDILNQYGVTHYIARNKNKASIIERFNLSIQRLIYQLCRYQNTNDWLSVLDKAKYIYMNRHHRTIGMSPNDGERVENQKKILERYEERYEKMEKKRKPPKFKVGDTVRISILRDNFSRSYHQNFTTEVWSVKTVLKNLPFPRYIVEDEHGEELNCILNENELIAYEGKDFQIEKVIRKRKNKKTGRNEYFVKWLGYSDNFNSWVDENDVIPLK